MTNIATTTTSTTVSTTIDDCPFRVCHRKRKLRTITKVNNEHNYSEYSSITNNSLTRSLQNDAVIVAMPPSKNQEEQIAATCNEMYNDCRQHILRNGFLLSHPKEEITIRQKRSISICNTLNDNRYLQTLYIHVISVIIIIILFHNDETSTVDSFQYPILRAKSFVQSRSISSTTTVQKRRRCSFSNQNGIFVAYLTASSNNNNNDTNYENYSVKELRQLVKELPSIERGILSKLTRKKDLISYLINTQSVVSLASEEQVLPSQLPTSTLTVEQSVTPTITKSNGQSTTATTSSDRQTTRIKMTTVSPTSRMAPIVRQTSMSAKDTIIEEVFTRYPPIREQYATKIQQQQQSDADADNNNLEECLENVDDDDDEECIINSSVSTTLDVRQQYHPIFRKLTTTSKVTTTSLPNTPLLDDVDDTSSSSLKGTSAITATTSSTSMFTSSDMDLIFVGTASCTPGITRGTSCTALRLNWQQRTTTSTSSNSNVIDRYVPPTNILRNNGRKQPHQQQQQNSQYYNSNAGTWLFDVGECTQVRMIMPKACLFFPINLFFANEEKTFCWHQSEWNKENIKNLFSFLLFLFP
jgi:hypothetical protein